MAPVLHLVYVVYVQHWAGAYTAYTAGTAPAQEGVEMQTVYLSRTQAGEVGLFTSGYLAWSLRGPDERARFDADPAGYCARLGFALRVKAV